MDMTFVIRQRLRQLGLEQRDLATAAQVTESYISQLIARKKGPPAPDRTDIYEKMGRLLKLSNGEFAKAGRSSAKEELKRKLAYPPTPLFNEDRELILRKCNPDKENQVRVIFEKHPSGKSNGWSHRNSWTW